ILIQKLYNNEILQDMEKYSELYNNSFPNIRPSILYDLSNYDELQKYHQEKERLEKLRSKISVILIKKGFLIDLILNLSIFTNVNSQKPSLFEVMSDMYRNEIFSNTALTMNLKNCKDLDIRDFLYSTKFPYFFEKHYKDLLNNKEHFKNWDDNRFVSTMIDKGLFYELFGILNQFTGLNRDIFNQLLKKSEKDIDYWRLLYKERKSFETVDEKDFLYHIPSFVRAGELESLIQNISNLDKHVFLTLYDKFFGYDELSLLIKYRENFGISDNVLVETFLYRNDNVMTQFTRMHLVVDNLSSFHDLSRVDAYFLAKNGYFEQVVQNRESFRDLDLEQLELYKESA
ncbi:hypothetical protein KKG82_00125, partial [Patescibacteria group bacterium]|nr:hypothetical protein [Patescibacteria group bacterium]